MKLDGVEMAKAIAKQILPERHAGDESHFDTMLQLSLENAHVRGVYNRGEAVLLVCTKRRLSLTRQSS